MMVFTEQKHWDSGDVKGGPAALPPTALHGSDFLSGQPALKPLCLFLCDPTVPNTTSGKTFRHSHYMNENKIVGVSN